MYMYMYVECATGVLIDMLLSQSPLYTPQVIRWSQNMYMYIYDYRHGVVACPSTYVGGYDGLHPEAQAYLRYVHV